MIRIFNYNLIHSNTIIIHAEGLRAAKRNWTCFHPANSFGKHQKHFWTKGIKLVEVLPFGNVRTHHQGGHRRSSWHFWQSTCSTGDLPSKARFFCTSPYLSHLNLRILRPSNIQAVCILQTSLAVSLPLLANPEELPSEWRQSWWWCGCRQPHGWAKWSKTDWTMDVMPKYGFHWYVTCFILFHYSLFYTNKIQQDCPRIYNRDSPHTWQKNTIENQSQ